MPQTPQHNLPLAVELLLETVEISTSVNKTCQELATKLCLPTYNFTPTPTIATYLRMYICKIIGSADKLCKNT